MIFLNQGKIEVQDSVYSLYNNHYYSPSSYLTSVPQTITNSFLVLTFLLFFFNISLILLRKKEFVSKVYFFFVTKQDSKEYEAKKFNVER